MATSSSITGAGSSSDAFHDELAERLMRYVQIDTTSDESSATSPSTERQLGLLRLLADELRALGAEDVTLTEYGAVLATIPATAPGSLPTIAFLAHVDTAQAFSGSGVKPILHRRYDGGDLVLPDNPDLVLSPRELPYLAGKIGDDIITASGTTLLGADDKAGVAIIMTMTHYLLEGRELAHGPIRIAFTPDEEVGRGVHSRLPGDLHAAYAYTLDGGDLGEVAYETFSADRAVVRIEGVSAHPGQAKDTMVNGLHLAAKIVNTLPQVTLTPETTSGRQGFIHLVHISGTVASAEMHFILRDFELEGLASHGELLQRVSATVAATEPRAHISCEVTPQYRNMRYWLEKDMRPVDLALEACRRVGVEPFSPPTRGGTDGSVLTERGVPTPNLFTGMQNIHSPLEWVSVTDMVRATQMCLTLAQLWGGEQSEAKPATEG